MSSEPPTRRLDSQELLQFLERFTSESEGDAQALPTAGLVAQSLGRVRDGRARAPLPTSRGRVDCSAERASRPQAVSRPVATQRTADARPRSPRASMPTFSSAVARFARRVRRAVHGRVLPHPTTQGSQRWIKPLVPRLGALAAVFVGAVTGLVMLAVWPPREASELVRPRMRPPPLPRVAPYAAPTAATEPGGPAEPLPHAVAGGAADASPPPLVGPAACPSADEPGTVLRAAVDLVMTGHTRAAFHAYRSLASAPDARPPLRAVVRLLERELRACEREGLPCAR